MSKIHFDLQPIDGNHPRIAINSVKESAERHAQKGNVIGANGGVFTLGDRAYAFTFVAIEPKS